MGRLWQQACGEATRYGVCLEGELLYEEIDDRPIHFTDEVLVIRVLLVEEGRAQAAVLSTVFADAGFTVEHLTDAQSALERVRREHFDLVVSDLQLTGVSGVDLCRELKASAATRAIPFIILTNDAAAGSVLLGLEAGADGFITKSQRPEDILARVQRTLQTPEPSDEIVFQGRSFHLNVGPTQLRNVLLAAFEDGVDLNRRLVQSLAALHLANLDLRKANEGFAMANAVKDKFLGIASHDLRSPLAVIHGFVSLLVDGSLGEINGEQVEALERISRSVDTMLSMLGELLDVSALRAGKMTFHAEVCDLAPTLQDAFDSVAGAAQQKEIELVSEISAPLPRVEVDPQRILEVVSNLLSNGVKFTPRGGTVILGAKARDGAAEIWVRDTGPGVRRDEAHLLFEPFSKLSARPTEGEPSTGLGLSIAREIVAWHGGTIVAESEEGRGATFRVSLPLRLPRRDA